MKYLTALIVRLSALREHGFRLAATVAIVLASTVMYVCCAGCGMTPADGGKSTTPLNSNLSKALREVESQGKATEPNLEAVALLCHNCLNRRG